MDWDQIYWLEDYLATLQKTKGIEATEEVEEPCFHVFVPKKYK